MSDLEDTKVRALRLRLLWNLRQRDEDVRMLVDTVLVKENTDIFRLAEEKPEVFDELHDACFDMIRELGEVGELGGIDIRPPDPE